MQKFKLDLFRTNEILLFHWAVYNNNLHWELDARFIEDSKLKKKDFSAANFNIVSKITFAILEKDKILGFKETEKARSRLK